MWRRRPLSWCFKRWAHLWQLLVLQAQPLYCMQGRPANHFFLHILIFWVARHKKTLYDWPLGKQWVLFPLNFGKQRVLFNIDRGFIKFMCRRSVGFFSRAFLVFLMKESKKRRRKQLGKLMAKSCSQPVNLPGARPWMNPLHWGSQENKTHCFPCGQSLTAYCSP